MTEELAKRILKKQPDEDVEHVLNAQRKLDSTEVDSYIDFNEALDIVEEVRTRRGRESSRWDGPPSFR